MRLTFLLPLSAGRGGTFRSQVASQNDLSPAEPQRSGPGKHRVRTIQSTVSLSFG